MRQRESSANGDMSTTRDEDTCISMREEKRSVAVRGQQLIARPRRTGQRCARRVPLDRVKRSRRDAGRRCQRAAGRPYGVALRDFMKTAGI
jgi:hypothetical protein